MKRIPSLVLAFILGAICTAFIDYWRNESANSLPTEKLSSSAIPPLQLPLQLVKGGYSVSIDSDPPNETIEESELWIISLERAQRNAEERLNKGLKIDDWLNLLVVPRMSGYEVLVLAHLPINDRGEEIRKVVEEEIAAAQQHEIKGALRSLEKNGGSLSKPQ